MKLTLILMIAVVAISCQVSAQKKTTAAPNTKKNDKATQKPTGTQKATTASGNKKNDNGARKAKHTAKDSASGHQIHHNCFCDNLVGKKDLDLKSLAGTWYVYNQQSALSFYPFTGDCAYGNFTYVDAKNMKLQTKAKFHVSTISANTNLAYNGNGIFNWAITNLTVDNSSVPINTNLKFAVVDVDYKNYTILFICGNYTLGGATSAPTLTPSNSTYVPPFAFVLLSRSKDTKYKMKHFNSTISASYDCYTNMHSPSKQDSKTCPPPF
ncbi:hypothetical protein PVAND_005175 [Polypedilum vanderplanki]|uniref:Lipocalin n=1 Tax=Polypedilum vanderplanki TaxID=319348 RepID=A0A9J6BZD6_POLVA|nr:hypothetical protein PVAND_005175 [Polypedilum vanderplanki]